MIFCTIPDVNVWLALSLRRHEHHEIAWKWYLQGNHGVLAFCRVTQMGLLRLATNASVAGEVLSQRQAWGIYDLWFTSHEVIYLEEPDSLEAEFRGLTSKDLPARREWTDSYLAAFASAWSVPLITFDRKLSERCAGALLLS